MKTEPKKRGRPKLPNGRRNKITILLDDKAWAEVCRLALIDAVSPREMAARLVVEGVRHE